MTPIFSFSRVFTGLAIAFALTLTACQPTDDEPAKTPEPTTQPTEKPDTTTPAPSNSSSEASEDNKRQLLTVEQPWVRIAVEGQSGTGAFLSITPTEDLELVGFSTDVAEVNEIHEMKMDGDVMRMAAISTLPLPANTTTELKPGSYHLMLMKLKQPLAEGDTVQLNLAVKDQDAVINTFPVAAKVLSSAPDSSDAGSTVDTEDAAQDNASEPATDEAN